MQETKGTIGFNYIMNTIIQGSSYLLSFIVNPYVSAILEPEGMGKISFVTAIISYFTLLAVLGAPTYGVREVSKTKTDKRQLSRTVYEILYINFVMGAFVYAIYYLYVGLSSQALEYRTLLLVMSPSIVLNVISIDWLYKGLEKFSVIASRNVMIKIAVVFIIFMCIRDEDDIYLYGILTVCATYGVNVWNFLGRKKYIKIEKKEKLDVKRHILPMFIFFSMTVATTIYTNLDMVMLGILKNDYRAGIYDSAVKLKGLMVIAVTSLGAVMLPRVTALVNQGKINEFKRISERELNLIIIFSAAMFFYVEINANILIELFSGKEFYDAVPVLRVLAPTVILIGLTNIIGIQMLIPLGREKIVLLSEIVGALLDLVINFILIPRYDALGAAIGTLIAEIAVLVVQVVACMDYVFGMFCRIQYYKIFISGIIAGITSSVINKCISRAIGKFFLSGVLFSLLFGMILLIMKEKECMHIIKKLKGEENEDFNSNDSFV